MKASNQDSYYIVIRSLELEWSSEVSTTLSQAFDLTDAEIDVARQFFENCDLAAVAALRKVSVHTVRTQMKTILSKTGATSQAELIRLFSMVASRQMLRNRGLLTEWQDPLGREEILMTNSGRKIAWTWMGAPDGTPPFSYGEWPWVTSFPKARRRCSNARGQTAHSIAAWLRKFILARRSAGP